MNHFLPYKILDNHFLLTACRTIFWEEQKTLILSDLHLGKSGHFRKNGIGIPQNMFAEDMQRLLAEIQFYQPANVLIVGDLFHSHSNKEHELFLKWRRDIPKVNFQLVIGNHDILKTQWYLDAGIELHKEPYSEGSFVFTHDMETITTSADRFYFSGHIHPSITIRGLGRQSLKLPCFYFNTQYAVLPAFGRFTGTYPIKCEKGDHVFALADKKVIQVC